MNNKDIRHGLEAHFFNRGIVLLFAKAAALLSLSLALGLSLFCGGERRGDGDVGGISLPGRSKKYVPGAKVGEALLLPEHNLILTASRKNFIQHKGKALKIGRGSVSAWGTVNYEFRDLNRPNKKFTSLFSRDALVLKRIIAQRPLNTTSFGERDYRTLYMLLVVVEHDRDKNGALDGYGDVKALYVFFPEKRVFKKISPDGVDVNYAQRRARKSYSYLSSRKRHQVIDNITLAHRARYVIFRGKKKEAKRERAFLYDTKNGILDRLDADKPDSLQPPKFKD